MKFEIKKFYILVCDPLGSVGELKGSEGEPWWTQE